MEAGPACLLILVKKDYFFLYFNDLVTYPYYFPDQVGHRLTGRGFETTLRKRVLENGNRIARAGVFYHTNGIPPYEKGRVVEEVSNPCTFFFMKAWSLPELIVGYVS